MLTMITGSKRLAVLLLVALLASAAHASNGFDILRQDPTPRGAALASHPIALSYGDPGAIAYNPAGLSGVDRRSALVSYTDHHLDLSGGQVAYAMPYKKGVGAVGVNWFSYGEFQRRESFETPANGSFTPSDFVLSAAYAQPLFYGISAGATAKMLRMEIDQYTSTAFAADLGAMWREDVNGVTLAATLSNLGYQLSTFDGFREELPLTARLAFAKQLAHLPLELNATAHYELDGSFYATGGGEFTISPQLKLRAGYTTLASDYAVGGAEDGTAGISAGLGLFVDRFRLDYAFLSQGALGSIHRFGFGLML
ncbi:PorV/PorQ family protein [bacterium]|nr:PorV/PorQ family protein [bacterium]